MVDTIEFDWDADNTRHLARHKVSPAEFEELLLNDPIDLHYEVKNGEDRYRSVGVTNQGRLLSTVWTIRDGKVRAITAFRASVSDKKAWLQRSK